MISWQPLTFHRCLNGSSLKMPNWYKLNNHIMFDLWLRLYFVKQTSYFPLKPLFLSLSYETTHKLDFILVKRAIEEDDSSSRIKEWAYSLNHLFFWLKNTCFDEYHWNLANFGLVFNIGMTIVKLCTTWTADLWERNIFKLSLFESRIRAFNPL